MHAEAEVVAERGVEPSCGALPDAATAVGVAASCDAPLPRAALFLGALDAAGVNARRTPARASVAAPRGGLRTVCGNGTGGTGAAWAAGGAATPSARPAVRMSSWRV